MCVKFQLSSFSSFRNMRGSQIYTIWRCAPHAPRKKVFIPEKNTWPYLNVCKISAF